MYFLELCALHGAEVRIHHRIQGTLDSGYALRGSLNDPQNRSRRWRKEQNYLHQPFINFEFSGPFRRLVNITELSSSVSGYLGRSIEPVSTYNSCMTFTYT